jgi:hypothetical protein
MIFLYSFLLTSHHVKDAIAILIMDGMNQKYSNIPPTTREFIAKENDCFC